MDPLNNMCDALVSIRNVLQKGKQKKIEDRSNESTLTEENFHRARLSNRNIDELPNVDDHDINRLKLIDVYTMRDLLGRYLIHDTSDEFYTFLIKTYQLSKSAAATITQLLYHWTQYHLDGITDKES